MQTPGFADHAQPAGAPPHLRQLWPPCCQRCYALAFVLAWGALGPSASAQLSVAGSGPQSVLLAWQTASARNVVGYKIYYGLKSRSYTHVLTVGNVSNTVVSGLSPGVLYYFAATAYDARGQESNFSNEATARLPLNARRPSHPVRAPRLNR